MSRKCFGEISGASGISLKKRPVMIGESTSFSSDTSLKFTRFPERAFSSSAVPNFQPSGNRIEGSKRTSPAGAPDGYSATSFQLTTARFGPVEAPDEKPLGGAVDRKSALAS